MPRPFPTLLLLALALTTSLASAAPPELAEHAPRWRAGTWWAISVLEREPSAPGPRAPLSKPLRGLPPLVDGVPRGWRLASRWRFQVRGRERVGRLDTWKVVARRVGRRAAPVELFYRADDLRLVEVRTRLGGRSRTHAFQDKVQLEPALAALLALPLDWPSLVEGPAIRPLRGPGGARVDQVTRAETTAAPARADVTVLLRVDERTRAQFRFRAGLPWWQELRTRTLRARLTAHGHGCTTAKPLAKPAPAKEVPDSAKDTPPRAADRRAQ